MEGDNQKGGETGAAGGMGGRKPDGGGDEGGNGAGGGERADERGAVGTMFWFYVHVEHRSSEELSSTWDKGLLNTRNVAVMHRDYA